MYIQQFNSLEFDSGVSLDLNLGFNAKRLYMLPYSIALKPFSLAHLEVRVWTLGIHFLFQIHSCFFCFMLLILSFDYEQTLPSFLSY